MIPRYTIQLVVWLIFLLTLIHARRQTDAPFNRRMWSQYFLSVLAFTFWGDSAEQLLDQYFYGLPMALYLKYICLIWVCHLYLQMLKDVTPSLHIPAALDHVFPMMVGLGLVSFAMYAVFHPIPLMDLRYVVIGLRDAVILIYIVFGLGAGTWAMRGQEQVFAMRLKQTAVVLFFIFFTLTAVGSISAMVMTAFHVGDAAFAAHVMEPFVYPAALCFVITLVPYRWYAVLLHVKRLMIYYQLRQVERTVVPLAGTPGNRYTMSHLVLHPAHLELAIYRTVIAILDSYALIDRGSQSVAPIFVRIERCAQTNPDYADLVNALAGVKR
jgi:hypothetical protein